MADDNSQQSDPLKAFEKQVQEVAEQVDKSVVTVINRIGPADADPGRPFEGPPGFYPARIGMGVIVTGTDDRISILTCAHVVENFRDSLESGMTQSIDIYFGREKLTGVTLHASDPRVDLAILVCDRPMAMDLSSVEFIPKHTISKGTVLLASGGPKDTVKSRVPNVAFSICQATGRRQTPNPSDDETKQTLHDLGSLIQVELPNSLRFSGTPLFNLDGQFAAIVTSVAVPTDGTERTTLAIPMTYSFSGVVQSLSNGFEVEYGFLGISPGTASSKLLEPLRPEIQHPSAAIINRISDDSPAEFAGLQARDLVLRVGDRDVYSSDDLVREIGLRAPGYPVDLLVYRKNGRGLHTVSVKLAKWPVSDESKIVAARPRYLPWRGMSIDFSTSRRRFLPSRFLTRFPQGVLIVRVNEESPASESGLQTGQFIVKVDDQTIQTPLEFYEAIRGKTEQVSLTLMNGDVVRLDAKTDPLRQQVGDKE